MVRYHTASATALLMAAAAATFVMARPPTPKTVLPTKDEQWVPKLARIQSIDAAMPVVKEYITKQRGTRDERIAKGIDQFVRDRFVHGFSYIPLRDNWILSILNVVIGRDLNVPLKPDEILQHRRAMCSQQSIIFMQLLRRFNVRFASVLMDWPEPNKGGGHFAVAALIDGTWQYFDTDLEARSTVPVSSLIDGTAIPALYPDNPRMINGLRYASANGGIKLAYVDEYPAPRGLAIQTGTRILSGLAPLIFLLSALLIMLRRRNLAASSAHSAAVSARSVSSSSISRASGSCTVVATSSTRRNGSAWSP
jgi:hypothetical protein